MIDVILAQRTKQRRRNTVLYLWENLPGGTVWMANAP
jgi:hypothetical protein